MPIRHVSPGIFSQTEKRTHIFYWCKPCPLYTCAPAWLPPTPTPRHNFLSPSKLACSSHGGRETARASPCPQRVRDRSGPCDQEPSRRKKAVKPLFGAECLSKYSGSSLSWTDSFSEGRLDIAEASRDWHKSGERVDLNLPPPLPSPKSPDGSPQISHAPCLQMTDLLLQSYLPRVPFQLRASITSVLWLGCNPTSTGHQMPCSQPFSPTDITPLTIKMGKLRPRERKGLV